MLLRTGFYILLGLFISSAASQAAADTASNAANAAPASPPAATSNAAPIPIERFFGYPGFSGALLSPDGRTVAVRLTPATGRVRLATIDLATNKIAVVAQFDDVDVGTFSWVNDQRLVYSVTDREIAQGEVRYGPGLYAVNSDGKGFLQLVSRSRDTSTRSRVRELLDWNTRFKASVGDRSSPMVYVEQAVPDAANQLRRYNLLLLNTLNGTYKSVSGPTNDIQRWLVDQQGVPRIAESIDDNHAVYYYQAAEGAGWNKLTEFDLYSPHGRAFNPDFFGPDGVLYVRAEYGDKRALYTFDLVNKKLSAKPLVVLEGYDFTGGLIFNQNKVLGVQYETDTHGTTWFDEKMKAIQQAVDAKLPGTINSLSVAKRPETPYVLVTSYSDRQPLFYGLYNTDTQALTVIGDTYPDIDATQMSHKEMLRYRARDGLQIPAYLTLPKNGTGKNLPLVVLVHGGPWLRGGHWAWNPEVQFLASRGYAVLEPDYRGSTGYGDKLFRAGWKQWGLKMQDDVADGTRWAIAQGIADPKRICIAGASYGGYAALMGLVNDPGLYRCGIDWAGVTDINLLRDGHWTGDSDLSETYKKYGMPLLVGDPVKDAAQLEATSPLLQAARITQPLLLAYGGADKRVPLVHGKKFYNAVRQTNPNVEWVVYDDEGHGWALPKNRVDFWHRVELFLDHNIGH